MANGPAGICGGCFCARHRLSIKLLSPRTTLPVSSFRILRKSFGMSLFRLGFLQFGAFDRWISAFVSGCAMLMCLTATSGCSVFDRRNDSAVGTGALNLLQSFVSHHPEMQPRIDLEELRPTAQPAVIEPQQLLELTVWNLYSPGQSHTFPARVSDHGTLAVPMLDEIAVQGLSLPEVEQRVIAAYREAEILVDPQVLVRSLDTGTLHVQLQGAVSRNGFVELQRDNGSVHAAIVSAGGLKKTAGKRIGVARRVRTVNVAAGSTEPGNAATDTTVTVAKPAIQTASIDPSAADRDMIGDNDNHSHSGSDLPGGVVHARHSVGQTAMSEIEWYDTTVPADVERLRRLVLRDSDKVVVEAQAAPLSIAGNVLRPGSYPLSPDEALDLRTAIELAGGTSDSSGPNLITIVRPAQDNAPGKRWTLVVNSADKIPAASFTVRAGDTVVVERRGNQRWSGMLTQFWPRERTQGSSITAADPSTAQPQNPTEDNTTNVARPVREP